MSFIRNKCKGYNTFFVGRHPINLYRRARVICCHPFAQHGRNYIVRTRHCRFFRTLRKVHTVALTNKSLQRIENGFKLFHHRQRNRVGECFFDIFGSLERKRNHVYAGFGVSNQTVLVSSEFLTVFGDTPDRVHYVRCKTVGVIISMDTEGIKFVHIHFRAGTDCTVKVIGGDLHPHGVDSGIAREDHRLARTKLCHLGILILGPADEPVVRTVRLVSFKSGRQFQQSGTVCDHFEGCCHITVCRVMLHHFHNGVFGGGSPKSREGLVASHINAVVGGMDNMVAIGSNLFPTEEGVIVTRIL